MFQQLQKKTVLPFCDFLKKKVGKVILQTCLPGTIVPLFKTLRFFLFIPQLDSACQLSSIHVCIPYRLKEKVLLFFRYGKVFPFTALLGEKSEAGQNIQFLFYSHKTCQRVVLESPESANCQLFSSSCYHRIVKNLIATNDRWLVKLLSVDHPSLSFFASLSTKERDLRQAVLSTSSASSRANTFSLLEIMVVKLFDQV